MPKCRAASARRCDVSAQCLLAAWPEFPNTFTFASRSVMQELPSNTQAVGAEPYLLPSLAQDRLGVYREAKRPGYYIKWTNRVRQRSGFVLYEQRLGAFTDACTANLVCNWLVQIKSAWMLRIANVGRRFVDEYLLPPAIRAEDGGKTCKMFCDEGDEWFIRVGDDSTRRLSPQRRTPRCECEGVLPQVIRGVRGEPLAIGRDARGDEMTLLNPCLMVTESLEELTARLEDDLLSTPDGG